MSEVSSFQLAMKVLEETNRETFLSELRSMSEPYFDLVCLEYQNQDLVEKIHAELGDDIELFFEWLGNCNEFIYIPPSIRWESYSELYMKINDVVAFLKDQNRGEFIYLLSGDKFNLYVMSSDINDVEIEIFSYIEMWRESAPVQTLDKLTISYGYERVQSSLDVLSINSVIES